jgi:hypothetical protein
MPTPVAPERRPLSIDVNDDDEVRRWLAQMVSEQIMTRREPVPAIHLLKDDHEEVLDWTRVRQSDPEADLAATWAVVAARRDIDRRVLVVRLEHPDGTSEACMFEETWEDGEPTAWWFGHRRYAVVDGIGQLLDSGWHQNAGEGRAPEPFASMLTPAPGARAARLIPARAPEAQVWMQTDEVAVGARLPTTAMEMTEQTQAVVIGSLEREGFKHLLVFLIRGRTWEKWLLGDLPTAGDDMVRWICGRLGQPDGVATAEAVLAQVDGKPERVVRIVAEMGGRRAERAIIMLPKPGKPEDVVPGRWMARELGPVPDGEGWIGVEPVLAGEVIATVLGYGTPK